MKLGQNLATALAQSYLMIGVIPWTQDLADYFSSQHSSRGLSASTASSSDTTSTDSLSQQTQVVRDASSFIRPRKYKQ